MPRLSPVHDQARRRIASAAAAGLGPRAVAARVTAALDAAIGFDGHRLFGVDPATLLINRLLDASDNDGWARRIWLRHVYLAADRLDYIELPNLMRANLPAVAIQDRQDRCWGYPPAMLAPVSAPDHRRLFHENGSPVGGTLLAGFNAGGRWLGALQAYRRDPKRPFRAADVGLLRAVAPTIGQALAAALARERAAATTADAGPDASGFLLVDPSGPLRYATPAGEAWASRLGALDRDEGAPLPAAVWSAIAGLRAAGDGAAANALIVPTPTGPLRVEASPGGPDGSVAVVLAPVRPPAPPAIPPDWPLTERERAVVDSLLRGQSNRQIAASLFLAEHTIEWHLRRAYTKLGVSSRNEVQARFFREAVLGTTGEGSGG